MKTLTITILILAFTFPAFAVDGGVAFFGQKLRDEAKKIEVMIARYKAELLDMKTDMSKEQLIWYESKFNNKLNEYSGTFRDLLDDQLRGKFNKSIKFMKSGKRAQALVAIFDANQALVRAVDDAEAGAMINIKAEVVH